MKQKFRKPYAPPILATLLAVLLALFVAIPGEVLAAPAEGFAFFGSFITPRSGHTATVLAGDNVFLTGGGTILSELYAGGGWFCPGASETKALGDSTATLLLSGKALIAGGADEYGAISDSLLCDASSCAATTNLNSVRQLHTATLLANGWVVVIGGYDGNYLSSAAVYKPGATPTWTALGSLNTERAWHTATLLNSGKILVTGGYNDVDGYLASAELFDPATGISTTLTTPMGAARSNHTATLLPDGKVLVFGVVNDTGPDNAPVALSTGYIYDPAVVAGSPWTATDAGTKFADHQATMLTNGKVLITGGYSRALYDTPTDEWFGLATHKVMLFDGATWSTPGYTLAEERQLHTASLLADGKVVIAGGNWIAGTCTALDPCTRIDLKTSEIYTPSQTLNVTISGDGTGKVTTDTTPVAATCTKDLSGSNSGNCAALETHLSGDSIILTAVPDPADVLTTNVVSTFVGWTGCDSTTATTCTVAANKTRNVTAAFKKKYWALGVSLTGTGLGNPYSGITGGLKIGGKVTSAGVITAGCDSDGTAACTTSPTILNGTQVTLTATPNLQSKFTGWTGACTNTSGDCVVTMDAAKTVSASFVEELNTLSITIAGDGKVETTGVSPATTAAAFNTLISVDKLINKVDTVTLKQTVTDVACSTFAGWSGDGAGDPRDLGAMSTNKAVTATFNPIKNDLTVNITKGAEAAGSVKVSNNGDTTFTNATNTVNLKKCTPTTITATAAAGSIFDGWDVAGPCGGTPSNPVCIVATMDTAKTVIANFKTQLTKPVITMNATVVTGGSYSSNTGSYTVSWTPITGAAYKLERKQVSGTGVTIVDYSVVAPNLSAPAFAVSDTDSSYTAGGKFYVYRVTASKAGYVSNVSDPATASSKINVDLKLSFVTGLVVPTGTNNTGTFFISWGGPNVTAGTTFKVDCYKKVGASYPGTPDKTVSVLANNYSVLLNLLPVGTTLGSGTYKFTVTASKTGFADAVLNADGAKEFVVDLRIVLGATTVPASSNSGKFNVTWPAANITGTTFTVKAYKSTDGGANYVEVAASTGVYPLTNTTALFQAIDATKAGFGNGKYKFTLAGAKSPYAAATAPVPGADAFTALPVTDVTLALTKPENLTVPATDADGKFTVTWGSSNASGAIYVLQMKKNSGSWVEVYRGSSLYKAITVTATTTATNYTFRVSAVKPGFAPSVQSTTAMVTVKK